MHEGTRSGRPSAGIVTEDTEQDEGRGGTWCLQIHTRPDVLFALLTLIELALTVGAIVLMFRPAASAYFRGH